jgi:5-methylcytosine-specific restriction enzyme A
MTPDNGASTRGRGYDKHEKSRRAVLARDPVCRMCRIRPSTVADHIVPIRRGGARFDLDNGQGTCEWCHNRLKQRQDKGGVLRLGCDEQGMPLDRNHHWRKQ